VELRTVTRCRLKCRVAFSWCEAGKRRRYSEGVTRDISSRGFFILASKSPPAGTALQYDILLPQLERTVPRIRIRGEGRVVRVEFASAPAGMVSFAAASESFFLFELEKASSNGFHTTQRNRAVALKG
jgi:hypothetical protein